MRKIELIDILEDDFGIPRGESRQRTTTELEQQYESLLWGEEQEEIDCR